MNLMMNKYGPQCRHVGEIVGKYADSVGLDVHEGKGPRKVAKGPNPNRLCPTWKQNAEKVIGECARKKPRFREACGEIAVNMFLSEIARQPKIFSLCPKLEDNIGEIAKKAFGPKLNEKLGKHYDKHHKVVVKSGGCQTLLKTFKKGINKCAKDSNPGSCIGQLKAAGEKEFSKPQNEVCGSIISDVLYRHAVSKPKLRASLHKVRRGPKRRVAEALKRCKKLGRFTMKRIDNCASRGPEQRLGCSKKIKEQFDRKSRRRGGCEGLGDKIGEYARSKGLHDQDKGPGHVKASAVASVEGSGEKCGEIEQDLKRRINNCSTKSGKQKFKCTTKIKKRSDKRIRKAGGCGNLGDKLGDYARSKGLPNLGKGPRPKIAKPTSHGPIPLVKKGGRKCKNFIRWVKSSVHYCSKLNGQKQKRCKKGSIQEIQGRAVRKKFSEGRCPKQWDEYEDQIEKLEM